MGPSSRIYIFHAQSMWAHHPSIYDNAPSMWAHPSVYIYFMLGACGPIIPVYMTMLLACGPIRPYIYISCSEHVGPSVHIYDDAPSIWAHPSVYIYFMLGACGPIIPLYMTMLLACGPIRPYIYISCSEHVGPIYD